MASRAVTLQAAGGTAARTTMTGVSHRSISSSGKRLSGRSASSGSMSSTIQVLVSGGLDDRVDRVVGRRLPPYHAVRVEARPGERAAIASAAGLLAASSLESPVRHLAHEVSFD